MKSRLARILRKLANWLDPEQSTATVMGGGPVTTDPPP